MDMAAVENLNHAELIAMIESDVRSAEFDSSDAAHTNDTPRRTRRLIDQIPSSSGASSTGITLSSDGSGGCDADNLAIENDHQKRQPARHSLSTGFYSSADEQLHYGVGFKDGSNRVCQPEEIQVTAL
jgi:hypothetical protein